MIFTPAKIHGAYIIAPEKRGDERGWLTRTWCQKEFAEHGINTNLVQGYISFTKEKGTIRGLHYQITPYAENKLSRCLTGSIYEVIIDLRLDSPTYTQWQGFTFKACQNKLLFTPANCAHAFLTLEDNTQFMSFYSQPYNSEYEQGIRYNDPFFAINWPIKVEHISDKDQSWEDFRLPNK